MDIVVGARYIGNADFGNMRVIVQHNTAEVGFRRIDGDGSAFDWFIMTPTMFKKFFKPDPILKVRFYGTNFRDS